MHHLIRGVIQEEIELEKHTTDHPQVHLEEVLLTLYQETRQKAEERAMATEEAKYQITESPVQDLGNEDQGQRIENQEIDGPGQENGGELQYPTGFEMIIIRWMLRS